MNKEHIPARRMAVQPLPDGSDLVLCSFDYADWQHIKAEALSSYKRERLKTWTENVDLLPEDMRREALQEAFKRAEDVTFETLPHKKLDGEDADYISWWLSETVEGMLFAVWLSARHAPEQQGITRDDIANKFISASTELEQAAQHVGTMSASDLAKNSQGPTDGTMEREMKETEKKQTGL